MEPHHFRAAGYRSTQPKRLGESCDSQLMDCGLDHPQYIGYVQYILNILNILDMSNLIC